MKRYFVPYLDATLVTASALAAGAGMPAAAAFTTRPTAVTQVGWGYAKKVPMPAGNWAVINALSCSGPGDCVAGGGYDDKADKGHAFLIEEKNGVWGTQQPVKGLPGPATYVNAGVNAVSCASPGNCAAGGSYQAPNYLNEAFVVDEVNGTWDQGQELPGIAALNVDDWATVTQLSCASPGNCSAIGTYRDANFMTQVFVAGETNGTWGTARPLPGFIALNTASSAWQDTSATISCAAVGDCAATGTYAYATATDANDSFYVASETGGVWSAALSVPGTLLDTVSCTSRGNCVAAGERPPNATFVSEVNGTWSAPRDAPGIGTLTKHDYSSVNDISCPSAGNCVAVGTDEVAGPRFDQQAFLDTETRGTWGAAAQVPGLAALNQQDLADGLTVSCDAPGSCSVGGDYTQIYFTQGFTVQLRNGRWGNAQPVPGLAGLSANGVAAVTAISCGAPHNCQAAGYYSPSSSSSSSVRDPFVVNQVPLRPTVTVLVLSAASAVYGDEQTVRAAVAVSAASGTAGGTVTVRAGGAVACALTLRGGTGSCALPTARLGAGIVRLTATHGGAPGLAPSTSAAAVLVVRKATTRTGLTLSVGSVAYGQEQAERLNVTVSPRFRGVPAGRVTVKAGKVTDCLITLSAGKGSCTLAATALAAGTYRLAAGYPGSADFTASASADHPLTVTR
jgi:hypothetical protein